MDTKKQILKIGYDLIREKGYNAFSFSDIGKQLHIKNASIHYHFPTKTDLGIAIIADQHQKLMEVIQANVSKEPLEKLKLFFSVYTEAKNENKICLVGSLASDLYTVEPPIQERLKAFVEDTLNWVMAILEEGKRKKVFQFRTNTRTKALLIITNMLASLQLTRLTKKQDFQHIRQTIINDLINR